MSSSCFKPLRSSVIFSALIFLLLPVCSSAETVSFLVDPATIDTNPADGFITGSEFEPVGSDGIVFSLLPTNNLVGGDLFQLSETTGLHYGGGGGSTLSFDFSVNKDITLESYTLSSSGFFLGDPTFNIQLGDLILSSENTSNNSGDTHNFNGGPLHLTAGMVYSFETQVFGAAIQAYQESWTYTSIVPEPGALTLLGLSVILLAVKRQRS